uniref:Salivary secreted peptide n=1 Tax=Anopheles dirus TaxID=7168 RepID=A0A182NEL6_9DIPT
MKLTIVLLVAFAVLALATTVVSGNQAPSSAKHLVDKIVHAPIFGDLLKGIAEHLTDHQQSTTAPENHSETTTTPPA